MPQRLTKSGVAKRQLATAIRLLFDGGDLVSIYSLATNAWEIVDALCQREGIESISNDTRNHVSPGADLKRDYINSPYRNFFKHADRDADAELDPLPASQVDSVLFLAVEDYIRLRKQAPLEFQVFQLWYLAAHPAKLIREAFARFLEPMERIFPDLESVTREQQLEMGRKALFEALLDPDLRSDPQTELPD
ncbi:hypothetical protein [Pseudomonas nitroreducens]|uniref:hypothetical protein n=1 Tax=Pseudomonas nitroreducens TaxID=46680 RepID=UPI0038149925